MLQRGLTLKWPLRRAVAGNSRKIVKEMSVQKPEPDKDKDKDGDDFNTVEECVKLILEVHPQSWNLCECDQLLITDDAEHSQKQKKWKQKSFKSLQPITSVLKHHQKKCAKCMKLQNVVNILLECCLMALVKQSLEHIDLLITKMEITNTTSREKLQQYLQHGTSLMEKVDSFYARQDKMYRAFRALAKVRHSRTSQEQIKQGFELLGEMRELNNKFQISVDNFYNVMAERAQLSQGNNSENAPGVAP